MSKEPNFYVVSRKELQDLIITSVKAGRDAQLNNNEIPAGEFESAILTCTSRPLLIKPDYSSFTNVSNVEWINKEEV
jgi:hypothetical protein